MSSLANINIQQPSSYQSTNRGSFYQLPGEIRELIYDYVLTKKEDIFFPKISQQEYAKKWLAPYDKVSSALSHQPTDRKPTVLALAHTCRQAYYESSKWHYSNKTFLFASGNLLQKFVQDVSPNQVESIKNLKVMSLTRMWSAPGTNEPFYRPTSQPRWMSPDDLNEQLALDLTSWNKQFGRITEQNINTLNNFQSLETLIVGRRYYPKDRQLFQMRTGNITNWLHEDRQLFELSTQMLVDLCTSLPGLKKIVFQTDVPADEPNSYPGVLNEAGRVPGWTCTTGESVFVRSGWIERVTETLSRDLDEGAD